MNVLMLNRKCHQFVSFGIYAVRVIFADAVLCAVCGALYGIVFGGFGAQARNQLTVSGIFSIAATCGMIGFAIGALIGTVREVSRARSLRQRLTERATQPVATFPEQRQSRLSESSMTAVIQNPLSIVPAKAQPRITALGG